MPPVGFEPMISAGERPQTYALDRAATGTGNFNYRIKILNIYFFFSIILYSDTSANEYNSSRNHIR